MSAYTNFQQAVLRAFLLPKMYREVLLLCDLQGRRTGETANILGISPQAVEIRLKRARKLLQETAGNPQAAR